MSSQAAAHRQSAPFAAISISLMKGLVSCYGLAFPLCGLTFCQLSLRHLVLQPGYRDVFKKRRRREKASESQQPVHSQGLTNAASRFWLQGAAVLGSLIPPAKHGHLGCPPAIVALRTAVAAVPGVKELRPQALPTKLIAVGAPRQRHPCLPHLSGYFTQHAEVLEPRVFLSSGWSKLNVLEAPHPPVVRPLLLRPV